VAIAAAKIKVLRLMRKKVLLVSFLLLALAFAYPASAAPAHKIVFVVGQKSYTVDGQSREMDAVPFVENGRTFVPVRYLAYALGVADKDVTWDVKTQAVTMTAYNDGWATVVEIRIGVPMLTVVKEPPPGVMTFRYDRKVVQIDVAPLIREGRTYLPARFVAEAFGYEVGWDASRQAVLFGPPGAVSSVVDENGIDLREIEKTVFDQVNKDRVAAGLPPVAWDETAAAASRKHAAEMAENDYLSHWDLSGKKPQQRYTEAGGLFATEENAGYSRMAGYQLSQELLLEAALKVHAAMMAEKPPGDGHRKNILDPHHTHVGIGAAYALHADGSITLAFTQEFTNHYYILSGVPLTVKPGESFAISGRPVVRAYSIYVVVLVWEDFPHPMSLADLKQTGSYSSPGWENMVSYAAKGWPRWYFPQVDAKGSPLYVDGDGGFTATLKASTKPGLNYLQVWVQNNKSEKFMANEVVIKALESQKLN
jgi:uncharacterized protein YkwD